MKLSQILTILKKTILAKEPTLVVGPPGGGKTQVMQEAAEELSMDHMLTHPVVDDPTDYKGLPGTFSDGKTTWADFLPYGHLRRMCEAERPLIVVMDDLGTATPATQAAAMQLILAGQINGRPISPHVRFVAATNRREHKAGVGGLITPLLDRFTTILEYEFDIDDWAAWAIRNGLPPDLVAFARFRAPLMEKFDASKDMVKNPTPRSVAGMGRLIKLGLTDLDTLSGAAGKAFASEYIAFRRTWESCPSPKAVYADPTGLAVPTEPSVLFALMGSLAHAAKLETLDPTIKFLNRIQPEFAAYCLKDAFARDRALFTHKAVRGWMLEHAAVFGASA